MNACRVVTEAAPAPNQSLWRDTSFRRFWLGEAISLVGSQVTTLGPAADGGTPAQGRTGRDGHPGPPPGCRSWSSRCRPVYGSIGGTSPAAARGQCRAGGGAAGGPDRRMARRPEPAAAVRRVVRGRRADRGVRAGLPGLRPPAGRTRAADRRQRPTPGDIVRGRCRRTGARWAAHRGGRCAGGHPHRQRLVPRVRPVPRRDPAAGGGAGDRDRPTPTSSAISARACGSRSPIPSCAPSRWPRRRTTSPGRSWRSCSSSTRPRSWASMPWRSARSSASPRSVPSRCHGRGSAGSTTGCRTHDRGRDGDLRGGDADGAAGVAAGGVGAAILGVALFIGGFGNTISVVHVITVRQTITPDALLGRMNASYRTLTYGAIPVGAMIGGSPRRDDRPAGHDARRRDRRVPRPVVGAVLAGSQGSRGRGDAAGRVRGGVVTDGFGGRGPERRRDARPRPRPPSRSTAAVGACSWRPSGSPCRPWASGSCTGCRLARPASPRSRPSR